MIQAVAPLPRTQSHLLRIVSTLETDYMRAQPPKSLEQLEQYAEGSSSQLLYLQVTPCLHPMLCVQSPIDLQRLLRAATLAAVQDRLLRLCSKQSILLVASADQRYRCRALMLLGAKQRAKLSECSQREAECRFSRVVGRLLKGFGAQGRVAGLDDEYFDHAASHLGKAVGIANLLRGTAYHAARLGNPPAASPLRQSLITHL